jgi:hypothetical protein
MSSALNVLVPSSARVNIRASPPRQWPATHPAPQPRGEQPKFLARLDEEDRQTHVLVKFSPPHASATARRWADLLRCEHWAHQLLASTGVAARQSRWFSFADRTCLEVERFGRIGTEGRRGSASLLALDLARYGHLDR